MHPLALSNRTPTPIGLSQSLPSSCRSSSSSVSSAARLSPIVSSSAAARCSTFNPSSSSAAQNPKPKVISLKTLSKTLAFSSVSAAAAAILFNISPLSSLFDGTGGPGNFGGNGGGGGGNGGGGGGFWRRIFSPAYAIADEAQTEEDWDPHGLAANAVYQLSKLHKSKRFKVSQIVFYDRKKKTTVGNDDSFFEMVSLKSGSTYTRAQLQSELETLETCGMFEKVDLETKANPDGTITIRILYDESTWQAAGAFRCINVGMMKQSKQQSLDKDMTEKEKFEMYKSQEKEYKRRMQRARPCLLPEYETKNIIDMLKTEGKVSARTLQTIRDKVQEWYTTEGYACAQVVNFGNLNTEEVVCEVVEGDITQVDIQFQDKLGNVVEGNTRPELVRREMPYMMTRGKPFNIKAGREALRNINSLGLFSNIEVNPRPDEESEGGIIVEFKLKELDQKSAEISTEWSIVPGRGGRPTLAGITPGGTVSFEHRNISGLNRSILGSVTTSNFFDSPDDLAFKLDYVHPYLDGVTNRRNRTLRASCFNSRKLSPVFTGGPGVDEVPPIWVDRTGVKANITENFTRQSKCTYGLVMEEITARDESSHVAPSGQRVLPNGGISADGPPTTLSGTGIDRMTFAQVNITRDNTEFKNGAIVGQRDVFQLDQGLGIGTKYPFFNRHQLTMTRFFQLGQEVGNAPPPVLVLHGHYGGCVGDLPSYDAFTLGGPYSVRGYNMGELGAARNILELAAELRIPVRNTHAYAFVEHGTDLGTSKDVKGNPTEVYRRMGQGSSYGVGVKLGLVRAEYAVDHNSGTGSVFLRFGERF